MIKRLFDVLVSTFVLVFCSPLIVFLALRVRKNLGSPIFFEQIRPGLNGKPFKMIKFRTMRDGVDQEGRPLPDSERMTPLGNRLRNSSLDELPELWNVLKGEMSLVGPRPLLMQYLPLYNTRQAKRHDVKPGVTGWAQINGRNALSWQDKFEFDCWYVENQSFLLDIKILLVTVKKVLLKEGISAKGHVTTEYFKGNNDEQ